MRRSLALILLVAGLTCVAGLGRPAITDSDEAFYAEAGREMVESGDYLTPRYNYANRFQKPVLYYWGVAAGYRLTGVNEAAARLPSALAGVGLALLAWASGRRWFGEAVGRLAGLVLATSLGLVAIARLALPDLPLAFLISFSIWAAMRALLDEPAPHVRWLLVSAAAMGAAFLMKGPIGVAVPALVVVPLVVAEGRWRLALRPRPLAAAALVFAAIALPWYARMWRVHGAAYLESFFIGDNLERFATDRFNDPRPVWFYLPIVVAGMLPWSPFLSLWAAPAWRAVRERRRPDRVTVRLLVWVALPLALFTASVGKQPRYILPVLLPMAVGLAWSIRAALAGDRPGRTWTASAVLAGAFIACIGGVLLQVPAELVGTAPWKLLGSGLAAAIAGLAVVALAFGAPRRVPAALVAATVVLFLALRVSVLSPDGPETVEQVAARVTPLVGPGVEWTTHGVFVRNLVFYVGKPQRGPFDEAGLVEFLRSPAPVLALVAARDLPRIEAALGAPLHRIEEWRYFNVAAVRWRHLFTRNAGRSFRTVVLVANRDMIRQ